MGKKKQNKKPRGKDGVVYSTIDRKVISCANYLRVQAGDDFRDFSSKYWRDLEKTMKQKYPKVDPSLIFAEQLMLGTIADRGYKTIFIESVDVLDFLENSKPRKADRDLVVQAISDLSDICDGNGLVVHMPKRKNSIALQPMGHEMLDGKFPGVDFCIMYQHFEDVGYFNSVNGSYDIDYLEKDPIARLIVNLFIYMAAFPSFVKEGPPTLSIPYIGNIETLTVEAAKPIKDEYAQSKITPHMRRGHFRVLRSEVFKNKRFQAVYVNPSMVCGKASTVSRAA